MKKILLLLAVVVAGCTPEYVAPKEPEPKEPYYMEFRVYDASEGEQFNTALEGDVFYFPASMSDEAIYQYFGDPRVNENWNETPKDADDVIVVENEVSSFGYSSSPGSFLRWFRSGSKPVIVWKLLDAKPETPKRYRVKFELYSNDGGADNQEIRVDRFRAGL